jgi:hypothetical protein
MLMLADENFLAVLAIAIPGSVVAITAITFETWRKAAHTRQREQSRREIAAYIAEGSMSPEDGARLMAAGESIKDKLGVHV